MPHGKDHREQQFPTWLTVFRFSGKHLHTPIAGPHLLLHENLEWAGGWPHYGHVVKGTLKYFGGISRTYIYPWFYTEENFNSVSPPAEPGAVDLVQTLGKKSTALCSLGQTPLLGPASPATSLLYIP